MKGQNQIVQRTGGKPKTFSAAIQQDNLQQLIRKSIGSEKAAARFTGTMISVVASSPQLQRCNPASIVAAALRGEGMGLILGNGYYVVPYGDKATFILGYKGYIALAVATGEVVDMDCVEVREGEYIGRDPRTKRPRFDFSIYKTEEEAEQHPIIGYLAYAEMKSGFFRSEYWTIGELLRHADRYSKAFSLATYEKMINGELSAREVERLQNGSRWYDVGGAQVDMFKKTALRSLLNSGYINLANSIQFSAAMSGENEVGESIELGLDTDDEAEAVDVTAVEVEAEEAEQAEQEPPQDDALVEQKSEKKSRREPKKAEAKPQAPEPTVDDEDDEDDDAIYEQDEFFD